MKKNNYAFIDANNLMLGLRGENWRIDYAKFFRFLKDKYRITQAYWFIGFIPENQKMYNALESAGFTLVYKETVKDRNGKVKGNVDILLTVHSFEKINEYDEMILVSGDGDFVDLLKSMYKNGKEVTLMAPHRKYCSSLYKNFPQKKLYLNLPYLRNKITTEKITQKNG